MQSWMGSLSCWQPLLCCSTCPLFRLSSKPPLWCGPFNCACPHLTDAKLPEFVEYKQRNKLASVSLSCWHFSKCSSSSRSVSIIAVAWTIIRKALLTACGVYACNAIVKQLRLLPCRRASRGRCAGLMGGRPVGEAAAASDGQAGRVAVEGGRAAHACPGWQQPSHQPGPGCC